MNHLSVLVLKQAISGDISDKTMNLEELEFSKHPILMRILLERLDDEYYQWKLAWFGLVVSSVGADKELSKAFLGKLRGSNPSFKENSYDCKSGIFTSLENNPLISRVRDEWNLL